MSEEKYDYLSMVAMLYETGNWNENTVIKRVEAYADDNNIDRKVIDEFLSRLIKKKEYTKEEKMAFLSALKFNNGELKYGDAVKLMNDDMIERYYDFESKIMGAEEAEKLHTSLSGNTTQQPPKGIDINEPSKETSNIPVGKKAANPEGSGEYSFKGGERTIISSNSTNTQRTSGHSQTSSSQQSSGPKSEPETEQDYESVAKNMGSAESDSTVRHVDASTERVEKLKKGKGKVKQFFLKAGIVVLTVMLTSTFSIPLIGGYLVLAHQIKEGKFNMPGVVGQGVKKVVEDIMNLGKPKEENEEVERGKSK